uniref:Hypothetical conserved protein n=1 Tax=uncultured Chloroflexota bacterium TaxID=166587 RepID=H5S9B9_9CHLR|nr:hypothetical conserved protein [uncultured Chloroflexota bacterium]
MKATEILMEEHRVIERVLNALEKAAQAVAEGASWEARFFLDAADFVRGFADGCHHKKEENVLFTTMSTCGVAVAGGPIGVMLAEHEEGRQYIRALRAAAERWQAGDEAARPAVAENALNYVALLRQHILKENNVLFPMAAQVIPVEEQDQVAERFEHVEHEETGEGVHEKYLALAEKLLREAGL